MSTMTHPRERLMEAAKAEADRLDRIADIASDDYGQRIIRAEAARWRALASAAVCIILVAICCHVAAAQQQDTRKLSYQQAQEVFAGLIELDGPRKSVKDNGTVEREPKGYDIDMRVVILIATNTSRAKECGSMFQVGQHALLKKWVDPKTAKVPDEHMSEYTAELIASSKETCAAAEFIPIKWDDLKPTVNKFPGTVVTNLLPILIMPEAK
jgi:hypothetical protein